MTSVDEFQVIRNVLDGDSEAYAELVSLYHGRVLSLCLSMLLDRAEAEDAAQEAFLKAFISLKHYTQSASFGAWLYRIASNHCLDLLRKKRRHKTDSLDHLVDQKGDSFDLSGGEGLQGGASSEEKRETLDLAMRVLATLSPDYRQVLILREINGLSYEEISSVLRCSLDAVKSRLRRARLQLQEKAGHFLDPNSLNK